MIYGIGIDSVRISRIENSLRRPSFLRRVYSADEQALIQSKKGRRSAETAAACFAAKEAFLKAAGVGIGGFNLAELSFLRRPSGEPYCEPQGKAAGFVEKNRLRCHLSITHEADIATAVVLLEKV